MKLKPYSDAGAFLAATRGWLEQEELINSLPLGIAARVASSPDEAAETPYFAAVLEGSRPVLTAVMTPPYRVVIVGEEETIDDAAPWIIEDLVSRDFTVPGVMGRTPIAVRFAEVWTHRQGGSYSITRNERLYALRRARPVPVPNGSMRPATLDDAEILAAWLSAFHMEATPDNPAGDPRAAAHRGIENKRLVVWDDNGPTSMAGSTRRTSAVISIAPVYTPSEQRGRGYATALVAALSRALLDAGNLTCCLFADLDNPISNRVYRRVGFHRVTDFAEIRFKAPS